MNARLKLSDSLNLIKSFKTSGTITPSSKVLIKTLLAPIDFTSARCLIELGPGTGCVTRSILERMLQAVIPVCAGINLEYYFSYVDPTGYGCGTKLPHNITGLLGVMDGAASDLRPGLPWQMVEIHEPVRLLFVIETTPSAMRRIIDENEAIAQLVNGDWVQLAVLDAESSVIRRYVRGEFVPYEPESGELPTAESSLDWYRGWRDHLGFASIQEAVRS